MLWDISPYPTEIHSVGYKTSGRMPFSAAGQPKTTVGAACLAKNAETLSKRDPL
jgi:hypothetical protein